MTDDDPSGDVLANTRALTTLAVETWRLSRRIAAATGTSERIIDSHARLVRALDEAGIRVDDPLGRRFVEGTHAEIIDMPDGLDLALETVVVTDVLRPAVYLGGVCILIPQIILGHIAVKEDTDVAIEH